MKLPPFGRARARFITSADVEAEIAEHRRLLGEATTSLAALDASRAEMLIGDDVADIREHRTRSDELRMTVERLEARLQALAVQATEMQAAEASAALTARRTATEARAAEIVGWWREAYPDMARLLVNALHELLAVDGEITAINRQLGEAGRQEEALRSAEDQVNPATWARDSDGKPYHYEGAFSLSMNTRLMAIASIDAPGWGPSLGIPRQ